ncbi:MAG: hypothetical protein ACR2O6_07530 [Ilumatobacteraceae bacterium]
MSATVQSTAGSPSASPSPRRRGLLAIGIVVLVVGLVGAIALWIAAGNRLDDSVTGLARAPVGCDTTLDFSETSEFLLFVETEGEIDGVRGDCDVQGEYSVDGNDPPVVQLSMVDPDGVEVELSARSGIDYDAAGFAGESLRTATITTTGDHVLRVESEVDGELFVVSVGKDPNDGVGAMRFGAIALALVGLIVGIVCIVLGSRRREPAPAATGTAWPQTQPGWPQSPPSGTVPPWDPSAPPPAGPPQSWPVQPPSSSPPSGGAVGAQQPAAPPHGQAPGWGATAATPQPHDSSWAPSDQPASGQQPPNWQPATPSADPGRQALPGQPTIPGSPGSPGSAGAPDGSTGDGERSPWAPPSGDR